MGAEIMQFYKERKYKRRGESSSLSTPFSFLYNYGRAILCYNPLSALPPTSFLASFSLPTFFLPVFLSSYYSCCSLSVEFIQGRCS